MKTWRTLPTTLGGNLRAFRMGYRIFDGKYFLRMSMERNLVRIDLGPFSGVDPKRKTWTGNHICWWDGEDEGIWLIQAIPCLQGIVKVHRPISFLITQTGEYAGT